MKILRRVLVGLAAIVLIVVVIGFFLPSSFSTSRTTTIDAPIEVVFEQVNDLHNWERWSPWYGVDSTMVITYNQVPRGTGAAYTWTSEKMGSGTLSIEESVPHQSIQTKLDFGEQGDADSEWTFEESPEGVRVTWAFSGDAGMNIAGRYMGLMMDSFVGPDFEKGLAALKEACERQEIEEPEPAAAAESG